MLPLDDIRVLDLTAGAMGPFCTRALGDYGADVVKIEPPGAGDEARALPPFLGDEPGPERSGLFLFLNTNKRSVTLDLTQPRGRELLLRLVRSAHAVVENFPPGTLESWGLDYEALRAENPRIVLTSITNFGQDGPYAHFEAEALTAYAMGGAMLGSGNIDHEPVKTAGRMTLYQAGYVGALATTMGLLAAEQRGTGEHIDVSLFETATHSIDLRLGRLLGYEYTGRLGTRPALASAVGSGIYPCADGYFFFTAGAPYLPQMIRMIGEVGLLETPEWGTVEGRSHPDRIEEFNVHLLTWTVGRTMSEIRAACQQHGVLGGPLNTIPALLEDPSFKEREFFQQIDHPVAGTLTYPGFHFTFRRPEQAPVSRRRAPLLGEHTQEVLCGDLGLSADELEALRGEGVI